MLFQQLFRDWGPLLGGGIMMLAICIVTTQFVYVGQALKSKHWRPADGRVVTMNEAIQLGARYDGIDDLIRNSFLPGFFALPRLPVAYSASGSTYAAVNYTFSIDPIGPSQKDVDSEHPVGSMITIYYDPFDPNNAVVKPGTNPHFYLIIVGGLLMFILGFYIINRPRELI